MRVWMIAMATVVANSQVRFPPSCTPKVDVAGFQRHRGVGAGPTFGDHGECLRRRHSVCQFRVDMIAQSGCRYDDFAQARFGPGVRAQVISF